MTDLFDFEKKPGHYAVMGNPINHSKSPEIHNKFAKQTQQKMVYDAIHVDLGGFKQAVRNFQANDGKGLNITVPFKLEAYNLVDKLSPRAQRAGAVNTIIFENNGNLLGDNTDGEGLVADLTQHLKWIIKDKKVLILGAGGASRGVLEPILQQQPELVFIANRTASKAKDLADEFSSLGNIQGGGYHSLDSSAGSSTNNVFDIIINATSASLHGEIPAIPDSIVHSESQCYDMMYAAKPTAFMDWAINLGLVNVSDGLGMLVGQAAESFYLWRGIRPEVKPVIDLIRQNMS
jgi:shikimate dehydrogenase